MSRRNNELPDGSKVIYRPWIRTRDGRIIYASAYGKKVFRLVVNTNKPYNN